MVFGMRVYDNLVCQASFLMDRSGYVERIHFDKHGSYFGLIGRVKFVFPRIFFRKSEMHMIEIEKWKL